MPLDVEPIEHFHGDLRLILDTFEQYGLNINDYLAPELQAYTDDLKKLHGNQLNNFIGSMLACSGSLFAFSMNGAIAAQCTSLSPELRAAVAASPLLVGGFLRVLSAYKTDLGQGKESILHLLSLSVLGMIGNILILNLLAKNEDLSTITPEQCWPLILSGAFIGIGLGTYSSGMILGARSAANHSVDKWEENLEKISATLRSALAEKGISAQGIIIQEDTLAKRLRFILRKHAAVYSAAIAGIANTAPSIPITINAYAEQLGLTNTARTALFASLQLMIMGGIYLLLNNPVYDQLLKNNLTLGPAKARELAERIGQSLFSSGLTLKEEIQQLTLADWKELWAAVILYSVSYGVLTSITTTGRFTLLARCVPKTEASLTIARAVTLSSFFRAIPLLFPMLTPKQLNQHSLLVMSIALSLFTFVDKKHIPESMLYVYSIFCGVVCFAVVARLVEKTPNKVGLITGFSSGIGAFAGFPLSLLMAWLQKYNPTDGVCPNGVPRETMSLQLLLPAVISALTLCGLLANRSMRSVSNYRNHMVSFQPVANNFEAHRQEQLEAGDVELTI